MNIKNGDRKVIFELLSSCNLKCSHCFYRASNRFHSNDFLSKKEIFELIDKIKRDNVNKLVFTGGEPTLHPNFIEIARYAMMNISKVTICTNGVISNSEFEDKIIDLNFKTYTISVDSHFEDIHNKFRGNKIAFRKTIAFIKKLKENKKNISIHIAIHPNNINHIEDTINFCKKFSNEIVVGSIYYDKLDISDKRKEEYRKNIQNFKEKYWDNQEIVLVGFEPFCSNENCLDQKNVLMVNRRGELISCYWGKDGGKVIKKY